MKRLFILIVVLAALVGASVASAWDEPECAVSNPPPAPNLSFKRPQSRPSQVASLPPYQSPETIAIVGAIKNKCAGLVWQLGAYGCLNVKIGSLSARPFMLNCQAGITGFGVDHYTLWIVWPTKDVYALPASNWITYYYQTSGYAWVDYDPGPGGYYKSLTYESAWVPLRSAPMPGY